MIAKKIRKRRRAPYKTEHNAKGLASGLCGALCLTIWLLFSAPHAHSQEGCIEVAKVYDIPVCQQQIDPTKEEMTTLKKQYGQQPDLMQQAITLSRRAQLSAHIWKIAIIHKFGAEAITPSPEQIQTFTLTRRSSIDTRHETNKQIQDLITELLDTYQYSEENEYKLKDILSATQTSLHFYDAKSEQSKDMPEEFHEMTNEAAQQLATEAVQQWQMNRVLFETYGGRLAIRADSGIEPIDAYQEFLSVIRADDAVSITNNQYSDILDDIAAHAKAENNFVPESDTATYQNYFSTPDWRYHNRRTSKEFIAAEKKLRGLPTLGKKAPE